VLDLIYTYVAVHLLETPISTRHSPDRQEPFYTYRLPRRIICHSGTSLQVSRFSFYLPLFWSRPVLQSVPHTSSDFTSAQVSLSAPSPFLPFLTADDSGYQSRPMWHVAASTVKDFSIASICTGGYESPFHPLGVPGGDGSNVCIYVSLFLSRDLNVRN